MGLLAAVSNYRFMNRERESQPVSARQVRNINGEAIAPGAKLDRPASLAASGLALRRVPLSIPIVYFFFSLTLSELFRGKASYRLTNAQSLGGCCYCCVGEP